MSILSVTVKSFQFSASSICSLFAFFSFFTFSFLCQYTSDCTFNKRYISLASKLPLVSCLLSCYWLYLQINGVNLLKFQIKDADKYALALLDALFSEEELAHCCYKPTGWSKKPPLPEDRIHLLEGACLKLEYMPGCLVRIRPSPQRDFVEVLPINKYICWKLHLLFLCCMCNTEVLVKLFGEDILRNEGRNIRLQNS